MSILGPITTAERHHQADDFAAALQAGVDERFGDGV
jgi:hypothetical protein